MFSIPDNEVGGLYVPFLASLPYGMFLVARLAKNWKQARTSPLLISLAVQFSLLFWLFMDRQFGWSTRTSWQSYTRGWMWSIVMLSGPVVYCIQAKWSRDV